ncbi:Lipase [Vibrio owensii]|nr:Lipase [Vibrio owensii]CAH1586279.1 Lipase [Vibrio owensii]
MVDLKSMKKIMTLLSAISLSILTVNVQANTLESAVVDKDIVFKTVKGREIKLDLYKPKLQSAQPYPLLVWVHGGAWKRGSKDAIPTKNPLLLQSVIEKGYALAAVDYRLSGEASFPAPVQDINDALNFLHDHAQQYHIAADNFVMMGRSAGGHLAGFIGTTNAHSNIEFYEKPKYQVKAVVSFFGPTDLLALGSKGGKSASKKSSVSRFLDDTPSSIPDIAKQASSTTYVNQNTPPFIQLHGTVDKRVPLSQSALLKAKLDEYGIENQLWIEEGVGHSAPVFDSKKYVPHVMAFLDKHFPVNSK